MAKNKEFEIDDYISGYTRRFVKESLANTDNKAVVCRVCSYGGSYFDGMQIKDQIAEHGEVTVDISGYAASAATLIGLGAKHTRISDASFYLIHKVMSWVDAWGHLNEDQIADLIVTLEKEKNENGKLTFVAAKAYAEKSGKPVIDILNLMKKETWLTASEALEWGFVDEVYKASAKVNSKDASGKFNMMGIPALPVNKPENITDGNSLANIILEGVRDIFNSKKSNETPPPTTDPTTDLEPTTKENKTPKIIQMNKFGRINSVLGVESLESTDNKGVYFNEAQLQKINDLLEQDRKNKESYDSVTAKMDLLHPDIKAAVDMEAKFAVVQKRLAAMPSVAPSGAQSQDDKQNDGVNHAVLDNLPHMQEEDEE